MFYSYLARFDTFHCGVTTVSKKQIYAYDIKNIELSGYISIQLCFIQNRVSKCQKITQNPFFFMNVSIWEKSHSWDLCLKALDQIALLELQSFEPFNRFFIFCIKIECHNTLRWCSHFFRKKSNLAKTGQNMPKIVTKWTF